MEIKIVQECNNYHYFLSLSEFVRSEKTQDFWISRSSICALLNIEITLFNELISDIDHYYEYDIPILTSEQEAELFKERLESIIILNKLI